MVDSITQVTPHTNVGFDIFTPCEHTIQSRAVTPNCWNHCRRSAQIIQTHHLNEPIYQAWGFSWWIFLWGWLGLRAFVQIRHKAAIATSRNEMVTSFNAIANYMGTIGSVRML